MQTYFTAGPKEVRAWTVKQNASAPQATGVTHTDFEKGFIRAEVIAYQDFAFLFALFNLFFGFLDGRQSIFPARQFVRNVDLWFVFCIGPFSLISAD